MSALAAHPSSGPTSSPFPYHIAKDAPLVREMLASPLQWGPGVSKTTFAPSVGVREIMPGPPSPPAGLLQLQPVQPASSSRPVSNGAKVNGTVNGGGHANGAGQKAEETESEEEEEEEEVKGNSNAEAGPSHIRSPPASTPAKTIPNGHVAPSPLSDKGKGRMENGGSTQAASPSTTSGKQYLAASERPHAKHDLCCPISSSELSWPEAIRGNSYGSGLNNPSMACYANATLQVMVHTPPLIREALAHPKHTECEVYNTPIKGSNVSFCMLCHVRVLVVRHQNANRAYTPPVHGRLSLVKKGFSVRKQEDTHEFFRFATDALQNQALFGLPKNTSDKIKHTSWVHRIWGGQIRSRVLCLKCEKPSDTFDTYLDLALDCGVKNSSLSSMFRGFIKEDKLEGDNKYHCDNCKSKSNATKSFRIAEAPPVLTLHLKRFSVNYNAYNGRAKANKFNGRIDFEEHIDIAPYMVAGSTQPTKYRLFGVTCHRGHELRFGHYTAYVKGPNGRWYMADDEDMSPVPLSRVLNDSTAYLLSYIRVTDDDNFPSGLTTNGESSRSVSGEKRRREEESEEEEQEQVEPVRVLTARRPMIGPVQPVQPLQPIGPKPIGLSTQTDGPALFDSKFDNRKRQTTPVSPPPHQSNGGLPGLAVYDDDDDEDNDQDDTNRNHASAPQFGASLPPKPKFSPVASKAFYATATSPIDRGREPVPHMHHSPHGNSPRRNKHNRQQEKRRKKNKGLSPYNAGGGGGGGGGSGKKHGSGGGGGFGGGRKGMHAGMKPRHG